MQELVSYYLSNNSAPTDDEVEKLELLRAGPVAEVVALDTEISRIQAILDSLYAKRSIAQTPVDEIDAILSPARRIPADIWGEIFYQCLPTHRDALMNASEAPLLLTRVCSSWRSIAFSTPQIWSSLCIQIIDQDVFVEYPDIQDSGPDDAYHDIRQTQNDIIREWLSRSGACPISITILSRNAPPYPSLHDPLWKLLGDVSDRWQKVEVNSLSTNPALWERMLLFTTSDLMSVKELRLASINSKDTPTPPNLRELIIGHLDMQSLRQVPQSWKQLTHLCIHRNISEMSAHQILQITTGLVELHIAICSDNHALDPGNNQEDWAASAGSVNLPHLNIMTVDEYGYTLNFYETLQAPSLQAFGCTSSRYRRPLDELLAPGMFSLLRRVGSTLTKFILDVNPPLNTQEFKTCFELLPKITHLILGDMSEFDSQKNVHSGYETYDLTSFFELLSPSSFHPTLLPNLEILDGIQFDLTNDEALRTFLLARIDPKEAGLATLQRVGIAFRRRESINISGEIEEVACKRGIQLDFPLLIMGGSEPPCLRMISSSSGLRPTSDKSWPYVIHDFS